MNKISIRFFNDREVRAVWDESNSKWYFSVLDVVGALNDQSDYEKTRNYWKYLKGKLRKEQNQLVSATNQFKLSAADGKKRLSDFLDSAGIVELAKNFPNQKAARFLDWFLYSENTLDGQSKKKAYSLFESKILSSLQPGSVQALQQIHGYIFGGLYDFAGQIRNVNISKGGFMFALAMHLKGVLQEIEKMPDQTFDEILDKYVEMNVAHPFKEGNGRSTRIWLDLLLKARLQKCVDWSQIDKKTYLDAMTLSVTDSRKIKDLIFDALTDRTDDREIFMKGIDYSYYYEEENNEVKEDKKK